MKIQPLFDRVLTLPENPEYNKTQSGIILGAASLDMPITARVIAAGDGKIEASENLEMQVKPGDIVIYNKFVGTQVLIDGVSHIIVKQTDILGKVEKD